MTPLERFEADYEPITESGCWLWTGVERNGKGYGRFFFDGKNRLAHRWSYEHFKGPIPKGLELDHLCRVRGCVNPDHLEAVTHKENVLRGNVAKSSPTCRQGHLKEGRNLYTVPSTKARRCRTCRTIRGN
jgi:hypothetical protein